MLLGAGWAQQAAAAAARGNMNVAVLMGGRSPEHDVSVASARQVLRHLDRARWTPWPVMLERDGAWRVARRPLADAQDWDSADAGVWRPATRPGAALDWLMDEAGVDLAFPVLHGAYGEDGTVQGLLELYDLPFVGSGCAASAVAMDKLRARDVFAAGGVATAPAYVPRDPGMRDPATQLAAIQAQVGLPAFAKVDVSGSTVGVARIQHERDLSDFFSGYGRAFRRWFAEGAVDGEEITVPVLGNTGQQPRALPAVGIYPVKDDWFTHEAKYEPGATEEIVPPRGLSAAQLEEAQRIAVRCHELLVCDGMSRTDMIFTPQGPIVLETNTIPGLTENSLLPRAAAAAGLSFSGLLDHLLESALGRVLPLPADSVNAPA